MFYILATLLAIVISMLNNKTSKAIGFVEAFTPLFAIALLYSCYVYFIPALFAALW
jgi:hypothetical protein